MKPIDMTDNFERLRDNPESRYAAKHRLESDIQVEGIWQCDVFRKTKPILRHFLMGKPKDYASKFFSPWRLISGGIPDTPNILPTEGRNRLLDIIFGTASKTGSNIMYVHLFKNNVTPAAGNTAATCMGAAGTYGICQDADYDDPATNAPSYTPASAASGSCTNSASKAEFTIKSSITLYGTCLSTIQAKTGTSGYLFNAKKFDNSRAVQDDDVIYVTLTINLTSS